MGLPCSLRYPSHRLKPADDQCQSEFERCVEIPVGMASRRSIATYPRPASRSTRILSEGSRSVNGPRDCYDAW